MQYQSDDIYPSTVGWTHTQIKNEVIFSSGKTDGLKILKKNKIGKYQIHQDLISPNNLNEIYVQFLLLNDNETILLTTSKHEIEIWKKTENEKFEFSYQVKLIMMSMHEY